MRPSPNTPCTSQCGATGPRYTTFTCPCGGICSSSSEDSVDIVASVRAGRARLRVRRRCLAERHVQGHVLPVAFDGDVDALACLVTTDRGAQRGVRVHVDVADSYDHIALLHARLVGRPAGLDARDERAVLLRLRL